MNCSRAHEYWDLLNVLIQVGVANDTSRHRLLPRTTNTFGKQSTSARPLDDVVAHVLTIGEAAPRRWTTPPA